MLREVLAKMEGDGIAQIILNVPKIQEYMAQRDLNERDLAKRMELAYSYVNRMLSGKRNMGARAIAGFLLLGMDWDEVFHVVPDDVL